MEVIDLTDKSSNKLESLIRWRCIELGVSESITPYVIQELKRLHEAKSLGSFAKTGKRGSKEKLSDVDTSQLHTQFLAKQRAHARHAGNKLDKEISGFRSGLLDLIRQWQEGEISFRRLNTRSSIAFKSVVEIVFKLGMKSVGLVKANGGLYDLGPSEQRWLKTYVNEEVGYFKKFLDSVRSGVSNKQVEIRVSRYSNSLRSVYQAGRVISVGPDVLIWWTLESDAPCPDCQLIAKHNPYTPDTLPTTPKAGSTRCRHNCYCTLRIEKMSPQAVKAAMADKKSQHKSGSAQWLLSKIKKNQKRKA